MRDALRIDKLLWYLRFHKTRKAAQVDVLAGHIRLNGRRIEKPGHAIHIGDILTLMVPTPQGRETHAIRILTLPTRRGPASEAQACWALADSLAASPQSESDSQ